MGGIGAYVASRKPCGIIVFDPFPRCGLVLVVMRSRLEVYTSILGPFLLGVCDCIVLRSHPHYLLYIIVPPPIVVHFISIVGAGKERPT